MSGVISLRSCQEWVSDLRAGRHNTVEVVDGQHVSTLWTTEWLIVKKGRRNAAIIISYLDDGFAATRRRFPEFPPPRRVAKRRRTTRAAATTAVASNVAHNTPLATNAVEATAVAGAATAVAHSESAGYDSSDFDEFLL